MWLEIIFGASLVLLGFLRAHSIMKRTRARDDSPAERRQQAKRDMKRAPTSSLRFELPPKGTEDR